MKLRHTLLGMVVVAASGFSGCAVCDTCDDFPTPCTGPGCGQNGMGGHGLPVMGAATPVYSATNDSAGPAPTMPPAPASMNAPASPAVDPTSR